MIEYLPLIILSLIMWLALINPTICYVHPICCDTTKLYDIHAEVTGIRKSSVNIYASLLF